MDAFRMPSGIRAWIDARAKEGLTAQAIHEHVMIAQSIIDEVITLITAPQIQTDEISTGS